jgi:ATPase subunit of ABC transporter with duplicated ATPase domains
MAPGYAVRGADAADGPTPYHAEGQGALPMLIEIRSLTLSHGREPLLRDLDWGIAAGERWALVGANGSGKSSLLAALAGKLPSPSSGTLRRAPGVWTSLVAQGEGEADLSAATTLRDLALEACAPLLELATEVEARAHALGDAPSGAALEAYGAWQALFEERGGFDLETRLRSNLGQLALADAAHRSARHASGGERRRARLAGALSSGAELLLLDEPTNHLDLPTRDRLAERLLRHPGAVVFASHDRAWIDRVATHVLLLEGGRARPFRGGYAKARVQLAVAAQAQVRAEKQRRARSEALQAMAEELQRQGHRTAQVRRKRALRELQRLPSATTPPPQTPQLALGATRTAGVVAEFHHLRVDGLIDIGHLALHAGERLALVGASGVGKTTLLRLLAGERESDDPRSEHWWRPGVTLWHADQHRRGIPDDATPLAALGAWVSPAQSHALLAQVRLPHDTWERTAASLSGGERARAGLALLMAREPAVVFLDEPTNDLDLPLIEALEQALQSSHTTLVIASHDERLIAGLDAEVVSLERGDLVRWRGGIGGWRRGERRLEADLDLTPDVREGGSEGGSEGEVDWDLERARAEEILLDPLRWGGRERARWLDRRRLAEEGMLAAWAEVHPPAAPPYRTREGGWRIWGEPTAAGMRVWLEGDAPGESLDLRLQPSEVGLIGHLQLTKALDRALTRHAEAALVRGAARLALYHHRVAAVQIAGPHAPVDFVPLGHGWWVWRRDAMEGSEGWGNPPPPSRHRRRRRRRVG